MKLVAYSFATLFAVLLGGLFVRSLPDAIAVARAGAHSVGDAECQALQPTMSSPTLGEFPVAAPDFTLKDYAGRDVKLSSLRGNVVLVNFWATWCGTCVVEMPSMEKLVAKESGKPFRLLAVSVDDDWAAIRKFFAKGTSLDVVLDSSRAVPKSWGTEKFPESFIVDKEGMIRYYIVSNRDWDLPAVTSCLDTLMN